MRAQAMAKITRAALKVFVEYGYHGATMKKITQATGLSYGLVYYYFPSKEKIFLHLVESAFEMSRNDINEALNTPGSAWEKIEKCSEIIIKVAFTDESSLYSLIILQAITQGKSIPGLLDFIQETIVHYDKFIPLIVEAQKSGQVAKGDPELLALAYLSLVQGFSLHMLYDKDIGKKITPEILTSVLRKKE